MTRSTTEQLAWARQRWTATTDEGSDLEETLPLSTMRQAPMTYHAVLPNGLDVKYGFLTWYQSRILSVALTHQTSTTAEG